MNPHRPPDTAPIGVLYENADWLASLFDALKARRLPFEPLFASDDAFALDRRADHPVVVNRVSPSSYLRGHGGAIRYATAFLDAAASRGRRVVNGAAPFRLETSKVAQHVLFRQLDLQTPRTLVFTGRTRIAELAASFTYPAILKPDTGGSGAYVRRVESFAHLRELLASEPELFPPDRLLLLQEYVTSVDGAITRLEFLDGELLYAMRVRATNTFNLCPAEGCRREPADPSEDQSPPAVEFFPLPDPPPERVALARRIVRAAELDVGGIELFETPGGWPCFYDLNATSVYREEICHALSVDATSRLADFIQREYLASLASSGGPPRRFGATG